MIVLSLFDGMNCGQIALRDIGIHITRYYASEVDKWAIQQYRMLGNGWTVEVIKHIFSFLPNELKNGKASE